MPLTRHIGWESGSLDTVETTGAPLNLASMTIGGGYAHTGNYGIRAAPVATSCYVGNGVLVSSGFASIWIKIHVAPIPDCDVCGSGNGGIGVTTARQIALYDSGAIISHGATVMALDTWYRASIAFNAHGTTAKVFLNGLEECNGAVSGSFNEYIGMYLAAGVTGDIYFDDYYSSDTYGDVDLGDGRVRLSAPKAAGDATGYTPSAGNNWDCVNEAPYSDADFVSHAATVTDLYQIQTTADLGIVGATIRAVKVIQRAKRTGATTADIRVKDNGTEYGTALTLTTLYAAYERYDAVMPNGGAAWTEARFNAFQIGGKVTAGTHNYSAEWAHVLYSGGGGGVTPPYPMNAGQRAATMMRRASGLYVPSRGTWHHRPVLC